MRGLRDSRLFSVQLEDHDGLFGPKRKATRRTRILQLLFALPAVAFFLMPSFKLGLVSMSPPPFTIPDTLNAGSVFTIPFDASIVSVTAQGHRLTAIRRPAMWIGSAPAQRSLDLDFIFKTPIKKWSAKSLIPHFEHPSASAFTKIVHIETPPVASTSPSEGLPVADLSAMARIDGSADAACWNEPKVTIQEALTAKRHTRHPAPQLATVTSASGGEVAKVEGAKDGEKTVMLYHGGGLYSTYTGLKETRLRTGEKISSGQTIGVAAFANHHVPTSANWNVFLEKNQLDVTGFLALSSRLCDLK